MGEYRNPKLMPLAFGGAEAPKSIYFKNIYNQLIHKIYKLWMRWLNKAIFIHQENSHTDAFNGY
ncbi:hypothetical protein C5P21_00675 [Escherichia coli]|nr:hypothetical protein [Escherichia coli]EFN8708653.1 hypothetical protein [Escherichia coli O130]PPW21959.1 hypothetical protein C5P21_00675 [Escherichia coli]